MQGISTRKHQEISKAISRYIELSVSAGYIIPQDQQQVVSENIAALKGTHDYYRILMQELQECLEAYDQVQLPLQKTLVHCIRRMHKELKGVRSLV